ncbi:MAG: acetyl-CoA acetyltransferase [Actinobacteria bacterium]|nr:acetyl-CoA acetyltransferase [Actinomycetota bacterium]
MSPATRSLDSRTPVLVGAGQFLNHAAGLDDALDPATLMCTAIRAAAADAGLASVPAADSVRVVSLLSWRYGDPAWVVAQQLGLSPRETAITTMGGTSPQALVNETALAIQRGDLDLAILTGGEAWRTRSRLRRAAVELAWPKAPADAFPTVLGEDLEMNHPDERARGLMLPVQIYPMFETAIRAAAGRTVEQQQLLASELWSRFSETAAHNPYAWLRTPKTAEEIRTPTASNRMIGFPYTKSMNSNNAVDMAAALIMCSADKARSLGVAADRWVFPVAGTDCHEHNYISHRCSFADTPAIELGGREVMRLAGVGIDDIEMIDLYSCFPSAVQLGARSLGLSLDRQLTRTGGLSFAGGPWNNYSMHAIATVMNDLRERPGSTALVWANGGYATKHSFGIYATAPTKLFRHSSPQTAIDALPRRELAEVADAFVARDMGAATIEAYTVMHTREGTPETALAACLLADGRRAWGTSTDVALATAMCEGEWVGRTAHLADDGTISC